MLFELSLFILITLQITAHLRSETQNRDRYQNLVQQLETYRSELQRFQREQIRNFIRENRFSPEAISAVQNDLADLDLSSSGGSYSDSPPVTPSSDDNNRRLSGDYG